MKKVTLKVINKISEVPLNKKMKLQVKTISKEEIINDFIEGVEAMTGLTFKELQTLLSNCALRLAEADIYSLDESYWEKSLQLAEVNKNISRFAGEIRLPISVKN